LQVAVDYHKKILDAFVGLFGLINNIHILHLFNLYQKAMNGYMFHFNRGEEEIKPYLFASLVDDSKQKIWQCST